MPSATISVTVSDALGSTATGTTTVTAGGLTTINVGETAILTTLDNGNGNLLAAQPIVLTQDGTPQTLSFYVNPVGGQLRLGIYSGNVPAILQAQTAAFTPVLGWNTQPVLTQPLLPAGNYWLAYLPASNTLGFRKADTGGTSYFKSPVTFGALPASFPSGPSTTTSHWSFYVTFAVTPPPPNVPIGIGLSSVSVPKPPNANTVVGAVNVTDSDGGVYPGQLVLGGTDAAKFSLTNGGRLPCSLVVGSTDIPVGNYSINLTAN